MARRTVLYQLRYAASKNIAPDDGLQSPKHEEHLMINKDSLQEFVHLVGLLIYTLQYDAWCIQRQID